MAYAATDPDWSTAKALCPLCDYNLHGLTEPRCPECGFAFTWNELLDEQRTRVGWLFEYGRGISPKRWLITYVLSASPVTFWRSLSPANPVRIRRLIGYWVTLSICAVTPAIAHTTFQFRQMSAINMSVRKSYSPPTTPGGAYVCVTSPAHKISADAMDRFYPVPSMPGFYVELIQGQFRGSAGGLWTVGLSTAAWPWLTVASLLVFKWSMRRAKISKGHVIRVAIYCCDCGLVAAIMGLIVMGTRPVGEIMIGLHLPGGIPAWAMNDGYFGPHGPAQLFADDRLLGRWNISPLLLVELACLPFVVFRLAVACKLYMRFSRATLTAVASQVMVFLAMAFVSIVVYVLTAELP